MNTNRFVEVVVAGVAGRFHYHLPEGLPDPSDSLTPGARCWVPFGRQKKVAYFIREVPEPDVKTTRPILAFLDVDSPFSPPLFSLLLWLADYYLAPLGDVLQTALPEGVKRTARRLFTLTDAGRGALDPADRLALLLLERETITEADLRKQGRPMPKKWIAEGWILVHWETPDAPLPKTLKTVHLLPDAALEAETSPLRGARQRHLIALLKLAGGMLPLSALESSLRAPLRRLIEQQRVCISESDAGWAPPVGFSPKGEILLNPVQKETAETIVSRLGTFAPFLLHGVTGSGKTEVYLSVIEAALARGKGAIFLVPEIGLTPALVARLYERFGDRMALLHSRRSPAERQQAWQRLRNGEIRLVVGARSALFAPLSEVGVIVVDEEHASSYKQEEGIRYHARDLALVRGRIEKAVVILGSATPSLESIHNADSGKYQRLRMPERIDARPLPKVSVIDLRDRSGWVQPFISKTLADAIRQRLSRSEQTLLLVNRRGFSPCLLCPECGHVPACLHCSVSLTYHRADGRLLCHHCGYDTPPAPLCAGCNGTQSFPLGIGTQQAEAHIRALFPEARIVRMDRDTTQKKEAHHEILSAMSQREVDILIGTEMISKGHDFPGVTLVGIVCADLSFHLPDFRATERAFQLLVQVAGRAGRGDRLGEVLIQSFQPDHPSVQAALKQDDADLFQQEMAAREAGNYPPFCRLVLLRLSHPKEAEVQTAAKALATFLKPHLQKAELLGPAPAPLARLRGWYRYHLLLKVRQRAPLSEALKNWKVPAGIRFSIDVDPQSFG